MDKSKLAGKWAIVTGASSGIGLEFSRLLASMGCNLLMVSNQPQQLDEHSQELRQAWGIETATLAIDLAADDAADKVCEKLQSISAAPYVLINDAGIFDFKAVNDMPESRIRLYIDLHMRAVTLLTVKIGNIMAEKGEGYILNMSSMSCWTPMPGIALYSATKAYIRAFSRAYRIEMLKSGVSVTVACPGGIATDLFGLPKNLQRLGVALGALATPEKFARKALRKTLKRKAQYINGLCNRISIVAVSLLPEWARWQIKTRLLDRLSHG